MISELLDPWNAGERLPSCQNALNVLHLAWIDCVAYRLRLGCLEELGVAYICLQWWGWANTVRRRPSDRFSLFPF
jgi:hypothetical protein